MRRIRFGIASLGLAIGFVTAYGAFIAWRFERRMPATIVRPVPPATDVETVRVDLCRMARAQRAFFRAVGRYASSGELRSHGDFTSVINDRWPYGYTVHTPV